MHRQNQSPSTAPQAAASAVSLRYVNDDEAGISRHRSGKRFRYRDTNGRWLDDPSTIARLDALAIPPAWTDVWICSDARGHVQATGRDQRGRKQYRYHAKWSEVRGEDKFASLRDFAKALPKLRRRANLDLGKRGLPRDKVIAAVVWLLDNAMIRVGSTSYARDNGSFGLTTLRNRHVKVDGSELRFAFKGKSGKDWRLRLTDRRMARIIRQIQELPGQSLFQYLGDDSSRSTVTSDEVNDYIRRATDGPFSSKDFRTWGGTVRALALFGGHPLPEDKRAAAVACNAAIDKVAHQLGNTRAVCKKGYIHPEVIASWLQGRLPAELAAIRRRRNAWMDADEQIAAQWLERQGRSRRGRDASSAQAGPSRVR
ncbi:DNA topoisomerase-1 [Aminobacter lissarensis]|uniref:DNA topoisomerase n=1 Tax=Aminobacter carboxidus TaxID=376165 RepID=A0A8E1WIZ3_9HYPH|nr:DNA topoisomerase IB [Aminobacter lissarensis]MBB6468764.1 DNA topoisomerase-1 [Aminobacter lissarensis]